MITQANLPPAQLSLQQGTLRQEHLLTSPALSEQSKELPATIDQAEQRHFFLENYGSSSLSYSSRQPGLDYFMQEGAGYIAYSLIHKGIKMPLCLADPICGAENLERLLKNFAHEFARPIFVHVAEESAAALSKAGYLVNEIGTETIIDLQEFTLSGSGKEYLRSQRNRAQKNGLVVLEQSCSQVSMESMQQVSAEWLSGKCNVKELSFLLRQPILEDETDVRKFFAYIDGKLVGFSFFDPIYKDGKITGYMANIHRCIRGLGFSLNDAINLEAMNRFKSEGKESFSLGFSPLYKINDSGRFKFSKLLKKALQFGYEHANFLYDFKDLAFHKTRYRPGARGCREIKIYAAFKSPVVVLFLDKIFERIGISCEGHMMDLFVALGRHLKANIVKWWEWGQGQEKTASLHESLENNGRQPKIRAMLLTAQ